MFLIVKEKNEGKIDRRKNIMNILVVGVGSIGERHVRNLLTLGHTVSVFDMVLERKQEIAEKYNVGLFSSLDSPMSMFELVLICTPTYTHVDVAQKALTEGCHVFIEKPIAEKSSAELNKLVLLAKNKGKVTLVGCNMRFHRGVQELKQAISSGTLGKVYAAKAHFGHYLPNWRKVDYKSTYSTRADQGGGILLECIHEFDYLRWLMGNIKEITARVSRSGALEIDAEDCAEVIFSFEQGALGHLHADCLQQTKRRGCEIIAEKGTIIWESVGKNPEITTITLFRKNGEPVEQRQFLVDLDEMYLLEMRYLIDCIQRGEKSMNDLAEASETLRAVELAKSSI